MPRPVRSETFARRLCVVALLALSPWASGATNYTISTFADDAVPNGNCTLREALRAADTNSALDACAAGGAADNISLPTGTYLFSGGETLTGGGSLAIQSQTLNPFDVTIDLAGAGRFLRLAGGGSYTLGGLEIANGIAPALEGVGGAVRAEGVFLHIFNFRFVTNQAAGAGGALNYSSFVGGPALSVHNGAFLSNSVTGVPANLAVGGAAAVAVDNGADADLRDVSFISNSVVDINAIGARGGALSLQASGTGSVGVCVRCHFQSNSAQSTAGSGTFYSEGGAVHLASYTGARVEFADCSLTGNSATGPAAATKVAALAGFAGPAGTVVLERLFVDFNNGASDALTRDVMLQGQGAASFTGFSNSQVTFGSGGGVVAQADTGAQMLLGHLTIADYPAIGASLTDIGGTGVAMHNSIVSLNGTNLTTSGKIGLSSNYTGNTPGFFNEPGGDYHLGAGSVAIDSGNNGASTVQLADLDHHGRIVNAVTDRGSYEFDGLFADDFEVHDAGSWSGVVP